MNGSGASYQSKPWLRHYEPQTPAALPAPRYRHLAQLLR